MGRTLATLVAVVLLLGTLGTARAERDLADAVSLAITEATNLEQEIAAGVIKGTKQARWLRRGKEKLAEAIERHEAGELSKKTHALFLYGISKLSKAFRGESDAGRDALVGVTEEMAQWVADALPVTRADVEELPESKLKKKALLHLKLAEDLLAQYADMTDTGKRAVAALFAYEAAAKATRLTRLAASKGFAGPCVLTEPAIPQVGGGTWQVSVDGAPAVTLRGESFVDAFSADERSFGIGSDQHAAPYISFYLVGPITTHPGTYPVERPPADEVDEYNRDFVTGFYQDSEWVLGGRAWFFTAGTITVEKVRLGNPKGKRRIDGTFSVTGVDRTGDTRTFSGRFHVCRFQVAGNAR